MPAERQPPRDTPAELAQVVERNIQTLLARRSAEERRRGADQRIAGAVSAFAGSMPFVYLHLGLFGAWIIINLGVTPLQKFDPSFAILAMVASVEAIFLSTFVLITQNRMAAAADKRADLDLQISLLAEHEITRLLTLLTEVADRLGVESAHNPELAELTRDVVPERVLDTLDAAARKGGGR
jgi:uncharacterized membrane protein